LANISKVTISNALFFFLHFHLIDRGVYDFSQNPPAKPSGAIFPCLIAEPQPRARMPASIFPCLSWLWLHASPPRFSRAKPWPALAGSHSHHVTSLALSLVAAVAGGGAPPRPQSRRRRRQGRSSPEPMLAASAAVPNGGAPARSRSRSRRQWLRVKLPRASSRAPAPTRAAVAAGASPSTDASGKRRLGMRAPSGVTKRRRAATVEHWMGEVENNSNHVPEQQQLPWQTRSMPATMLIKCSTKCQREKCGGKSTKCVRESNHNFLD
jgi:hypothetical protein